MTDIEKRAREKYPEFIKHHNLATIDINENKREMYIEIATEQKTIDDAERDTAVYNLLQLKLDAEKKLWLEKACGWLKSQADECFVSGDLVGEHLVFKDLNLAEFLKAMEE